MRRAYLVWGIGLAAYFLSVFNRSSLAVAGLVAVDRFGIGAAQLATFTMLQLLVYALMQVPVGLLVDRWGPRTALLSGAIILALAQTGFAFATTYGEALTARVFVGIGDSFTFICLLRILAVWFPAKRSGLLVTLSGSIGQVGAIAAAVPMTVALREFGWTHAYLISCGASVVVIALGWLLLADSPTARTVRGHATSWTVLRRDLGLSWAHPGTKLGFWIHFATPFGGAALALLWGMPYLVRAQGLSDHQAGLLISLVTLSGVIGGPVLGWLAGVEPWHRSTIALSLVAVSVATWTLVLAWPGEAPMWVLILVCAVAGLGSPASLVGLDVTRTSNPPERLASASGITNQGGFASGLILILGIGWVLDLLSPGTAYTPEAFRWAFSLQYLLWALGVWQILRHRRRARELMPRSTYDVPAAS